MKLFKVDRDSGEIDIAPEMLQIEPFRTIYKRDHGYSSNGVESKGKRVKKLAFQELAYIFHMEDLSSNFSYYTNVEERAKKIVAALKLPTDWRADATVNAGRKMYVELDKSKERDAVMAARAGLDQLIDYFTNTKLDERVQGKPVHNPKVFMEAMGKLDPLISSIEKLDERLKKNKPSGVAARGNVEVGAFEDADEDDDEDEDEDF